MSDQAYEPLNDREQTILRSIADGMSNQEIADSLFLSLNTVKWHLQHIFDKLGVKRRTQAVSVAQSLGLLTDQSTPRESFAYVPLPITPFIGREGEIARLHSLLTHPDHRLVTLVGPGGIGKTQLALAFAHRHLNEPDWPIHFVSLEALTTSDQMISAISDAIGYQISGQLSFKDQILMALRSRKLLLILDNFEHLLESAPLVGEMMAAAPGLTILVTSRERLNLRQETIFALEGLAYPASAAVFEEYSAIRLFMQVAGRTGVDFHPTAGDWLHISRICQLVEGMPLGIEIAAGWISVLTPAQIAEEIEAGLEILQTPSRDAPDRHRSMRTVFDYSWRLLAEDERRALMALSAFRGGFDRAAAQAVAGAPIFMLSTLVDKSLIIRLAEDRFKLHELLRQFAAEKLTEAAGLQDTVYDTHSRYYGDLIQQLERRYRTSLGTVMLVFNTLRRDEDNIMAGWQRAVERPLFEEISRYAVIPSFFLETRGLASTAIPILSRALDQYRAHPDQAAPHDRLRVLMYLGWFLAGVSKVEEARQLLDEAESLVDAIEPVHAADVGMALCFQGWIIFLNGDLPHAKATLHRALHICHECGFEFGQWTSLTALGELGLTENNLDAAFQHHHQAWQISERAGYLIGMTLNLAALGFTAALQGGGPKAVDLIRQSLEVNRRLLMADGLLVALAGIALLEARCGAPERALETLAMILHHPRCGGVARPKVTALIGQVRATIPAARFDEIMGAAAHHQLATPILEPVFTIDRDLINRLLPLLDPISEGTG